MPLIAVTKGFPKFSAYAAVTPLIALLWLIVFEAQRIYDPHERRAGWSAALVLIKAHATAIVVFVALSYVFSEYRYSRGVILYFGVLSGAALIGGRLVLRRLLSVLRRRDSRGYRTLLIGEPGALPGLIARLRDNPDLDGDVAGVLLPPESVGEGYVAGVPVLGEFRQIGQAIETSGAQQVLIALPRRRWSELESILALIHDETVDVQIIPHIDDYDTLGCEVHTLDGIPVVHLNSSPLRGWGALLKRITDIALSALALLILAPLFIVLALAIKLTSRGPIFYGQERMGLDGRRFRMFKFRSMRTDAETATGAVWARANDDCRTPIGAFLRATSLDELPQFWNVFVGDMSLVGPRPERPVFVGKFKHEISHYMLRHKVKAGITGWAQVNGWRGNTSLEERIRCDLDYIKHWSYFFDLKILCLTVFKGFVNKNAY